MKRFLAIDSATEFCSVALSVERDGEQLVYERGDELPRQHSQALLPFVNQVLQQADVTLASLDAIIVSQGPGSFTGVRIGASIAQGLAFSQNLPLVQVSTLAAMAQACWRLHGSERVAAAIDARMGEVYFGTYQVEAGLMQEVGDELVSEPTKLGQVLSPQVIAYLSGQTVATCGTGWETYSQALLDVLESKGATCTKTDVRLPHAVDMLALGRHKFIAGEAIDAVDLSPNYLRNEVTWQKLPGR
ncbi:MAG: tRNA (adenosine(37)-N6)-threonylcarbamoyltransferase complex dimerization subunit type 1 TsaB [Firmicutes bacterium]|nr:tRNA (adenosine(37)-N6)-threonylcarbamoyltransferase complex dimerization subunit type 1 TsaB [Bacillota bacterium]